MNTINNVDIAMQIVTMPRRFHSLGNISIFSLLEETGYFELHDQISEDDIRTALLCCPECVQEWMQVPVRTSEPLAAGILGSMMRSYTKLDISISKPTMTPIGSNIRTPLMRVRLSSSTRSRVFDLVNDQAISRRTCPGEGKEKNGVSKSALARH